MAAESGSERTLRSTSAYPLARQPAGRARSDELRRNLVPGGLGTRMQVSNKALIDFIRSRTQSAQLVLSICTGAVLLAEAGLLDGLEATTNKRAFGWAQTQWPSVCWQKRAN